MCLIALSKNSFADLPKTFWQEVIRHNPHGLGLMWSDAGKLEIRKRLSPCQRTFEAWLSEVPNGCPVAVHFREATTGRLCEANVHPFEVSIRTRRFAVMHNGTLPAWTGHGERADTSLFTEHVLTPALEQVDSLESVQHYFEHKEPLPPRNRMVLLSNSGEWLILGKSEGWDFKGTWLSNPKAKAWLAANP